MQVNKRTGLKWSLLLSLFCTLPLGCGGDADSGAPGDELDRSLQAWTSTNPEIEANYYSTIVPEGQPAGVGYLDLAITSVHYYLTRTDGKVERRKRNINATFDAYVPSTYQHLDYVNSTWRVIASNDVTRKIYYKIDNVPAQLGSYPSGVNNVLELTGRPGPSNTLELFIVHSSGPSSRVIRKGTWDNGFLTWSASTFPFGIYYHALCVDPNDGMLRTLLNYQKSHFGWYDPNDLSVHGTESIAPYTEYAYLHPGGFNDRFAPVGYDTTDAGFWGIDRSVDPAGAATWVIAGLPFWAL